MRRTYTPRPAPPLHMTFVIGECRLSGVGNLLGFFPTIMALSVLVFSVFQPVRCLWQKEKKTLTYCIKITILCAPRAAGFWGGLPTPLLVLGPPLPAVKVSPRVVV